MGSYCECESFTKKICSDMLQIFLAYTIKFVLVWRSSEKSLTSL